MDALELGSDVFSFMCVCVFLVIVSSYSAHALGEAGSTNTGLSTRRVGGP
jgi:hypothetical protein